MLAKRILLGTATAIALTGAAMADDPSPRHGWYLGLEGGVSQVRDTKLDLMGYQKIDFALGPTAMLTVGHAFEGNYRVELELGFRHNELESLDGFGDTDDGRLREYTAMVNAVYDLPIGGRWGLATGAGIGLDANFLKLPGFQPTKDKDLNFAAQGMLGLTYRMAQHWDLFFNYRYLWVDDPEYSRQLCIAGVAVVCNKVSDDMDVGKHSFTVGFRWGYEDAPVVAGPPPAPPPAAPKQFIIFFGFNKCNITAEADAVLSEAASAAKAGNAASVRIVGHTDSVGSDAYNQKLSECRANAAKDNLVGKGIADSAISTSGKGESELMVQTGDNVKEPQNRRATIDLQ